MSFVPKGLKWRVVIVEDNEDIVRLLKEVAPSFVDAPDEVEVYDFKKFKDAAGRLMQERFDLLILDLKDDADTSLVDNKKPAGLEIFETLRTTRFVPVVFYTALAHLVRSYETSFVRVVEKTESVTKVRDEVRKIFSTKIPLLARHVEEIQRDYMWDFVSNHWKEFVSPHDQADIAYLLARRLALSLEAEARRLARKITGKDVPVADPANVHPMEMYVPPPIGKNRQAGDIVRETVGDKSEDWMVLTPSCDFEQQGRLHNVLLARCLPLVAEVEFMNWKREASPVNTTLLKALIADNRENAQAERFKFLPGTIFFPDSVVDFQRLKTVTPDELNKLKVVASLDSPFAEAVLARFARYFGRFGTTDIDKVVVLARLQIGPREKDDLVLIALVTGDKALEAEIDDVRLAIERLWSAHLSAGMRLRDALLQRLPQVMGQVEENGTKVDLDELGSAWIVQVDAIASNDELRGRSEINRLLRERTTLNSVLFV